MPRKSKTAAARFSDALLLLIIGVGVGWLIGLSVSPVLFIILGSVIALVAGVVGALVGLDPDSGDKTESDPENPSKTLYSRKSLIPISPLPLTTLVIGLGIGSTTGIYVRTNDIFGADPQRFVRKWSGAGLGEQEIQRRLFDQLYPPRTGTEHLTSAGDTSPASVNSTGSPESDPTIGISEGIKRKSSRKEYREKPNFSQFNAGLFALTVDDCEVLNSKTGNELKTILESLDTKPITNAVHKCKSDNCLEAIKELLCPSVH